MDRTISRYHSAIGTPKVHDQHSTSREFWKTEMYNLRKAVDSLEARQKHFAGEDLLSLGMKELKQLERQLNIGVERIRSRKRRIISEHISLLKMKQRAVHDENNYLQRKLIEANRSMRNSEQGETSTATERSSLNHEEEYS